jgi:hypothetical protein
MADSISSSGGYLTRTTTIPTDSTDITIRFAFKLTGVSSDFEVLYALNASFDSLVVLAYNDGTFRVEVKNTSNSTVSHTIDNQSDLLNLWVMFTYTRNATTGATHIYLALDSDFTTFLVTPSIGTTNSGNGTLGAPQQFLFNSDAANVSQNSRIAGYVVYNRVFSEAEVQADWAARAASEAAYIELDLDAVSGAGTDLSGNGRDYTVTATIAANADEPAPWAGPTIASLSPADNATGVAVAANLAITYSENIATGSGDLEIWEKIAPSSAPSVVDRTTDNSGTGNVTSFQIDWTVPGGSYSVPTIVFIAISKDDDDAFTSFPPTDWNVAFNNASSTATRVAGIWRRFTSGSTASVTVTGDSESYAARVWIITGAHASTDPFTPTPATGASTSPDPPSATFPWGTEPTLVLAICGGDENITPSGFPGGSYTQTGSVRSGHTTTTNNSWLGWAELASDTSGSEDPPAFTISTEQWVAATVAFRPADPSTLVESIAAASASIAGATATVNPTTFDGLTDYFVLVDAGFAVADDDSAPAAGISDPTVWNFTTGAAAGGDVPARGASHRNIRVNSIYRM